MAIQSSLLDRIGVSWETCPSTRARLNWVTLCISQPGGLSQCKCSTMLNIFGPAVWWSILAMQCVDVVWQRYDAGGLGIEQTLCHAFGSHCDSSSSVSMTFAVELAEVLPIDVMLWCAICSG